jgi:threonyl-tRNA synthetase
LREALERCGRSWQVNKGDGAFYGPKIDIVIHDALGRPQQCGTIQLDFQLPIRFNLQYTTATESEAVSQELASETFEPDEYSNERFEWREKPLKPKSERPVMIHRAIFGSLERFIAILIEHLGGKWPLWLSPRQVRICPVSEAHRDYCSDLEKQLKSRGWEVELDATESSLNKKVRNA